MIEISFLSQIEIQYVLQHSQSLINICFIWLFPKLPVTYLYSHIFTCFLMRRKCLLVLILNIFIGNQWCILSRLIYIIIALFFSIFNRCTNIKLFTLKNDFFPWKNKYYHLTFDYLKSISRHSSAGFQWLLVALLIALRI